MIKADSCLLQCGTSQLLLAVSLCAPVCKDFTTVCLRVPLQQKQGPENLLLGTCTDCPTTPRSYFLHFFVFATSQKVVVYVTSSKCGHFHSSL